MKNYKIMICLLSFNFVFAVKPGKQLENKDNQKILGNITNTASQIKSSYDVNNKIVKANKHNKYRDLKNKCLRIDSYINSEEKALNANLVFGKIDSKKNLDHQANIKGARQENQFYGVFLNLLNDKECTSERWYSQ